jgi:hypothetical protein
LILAGFPPISPRRYEGHRSLAVLKVERRGGGGVITFREHTCHNSNTDP